MSQSQLTTHSVTSADGTTIGYRQLGQGPGLVIVHGSMSTGYNHLQLAEQLADRFTVYLPDRRGRGLSGPYREGDTIDTEVADLDAVLTQTRARDVAGVSFGAIVCLEAALRPSAIGRLALYEPPLGIKNPGQVLHRFDAEMARGKLPAALVTAMKGSQMGPAIFNVMPRWTLELMTRQMVSSMDRKGSGEYASFRDLAPSLHYESAAITVAAGRIDRYQAVQNETLLVGGGKSAAHFQATLRELSRLMPRARSVELQGLGHAGTWNRDIGGKPEVVASAFAGFFARPVGTLRDGMRLGEVR